MIDWARLQGVYEPAHDVPALLQAAETGAKDAWDELWIQLCNDGNTCEAGVAALPALASLAQHTNRAVRFPAIRLAGGIVGAALREGRPLEKMEELHQPLAMLSALADGWLSERPAEARLGPETPVRRRGMRHLRRGFLSYIRLGDQKSAVRLKPERPRPLALLRALGS